MSGKDRHNFTEIAEHHEGRTLYNMKDVLSHANHLLKILQMHSRTGSEFRYGTGFHGPFISKFMRYLVVLNSDASTLKIAKNITKAFGEDSKMDYVLSDMFDLPIKDSSFDIAFSQVLAEPFDDPEVSDLKKSVVKIIEIVPASVQLPQYPTKDISNKRPRNETEWAEVLSSIEPRIRYYGIDLHSLNNSMCFGILSRPWHIIIETIQHRGTDEGI